MDKKQIEGNCGNIKNICKIESRIKSYKSTTTGNRQILTTTNTNLIFTTETLANWLRSRVTLALHPESVSHEEYIGERVAKFW